MPLPHFTQARASTQRFEPVQANLFEVTIFAPNAVSNYDQGLVLEQVISIGGLNNLNPSVDPVIQKYKFSDRSYAGMPGSTFVDLAVNFTLNLNDANENYMYNNFRDWYKLIYDPQTGEMTLKKDYVGSMIIVEYNRAGDIFRKITCKDIFITGQPDFTDELNYATADPVELSITFRCDHWTEENVGG
jgi:hypothetical protein